MDITNSKPKIILASSLTTGRRFVKKQNLNGVPLMNFSIYTPSMLLKEKLIRLKPNYRLINDDESAYLLLILIKNNDYQLKNYVTSFGAASKLLEVINDYRFNENNNFTNLIKADYQNLLKDYLAELDKKSCIDYIEALSLLYNNKQKEECYVLDDVSFRPLEKKIIESMFDNVGYVPDASKEYPITNIFKCYGQLDEVANLLDFITSNHLLLGDVEVLYTDSAYENLIKGLCSSRNVPYTLKSNHAKSSNFVSFIHDILNYFKNDYKYELLENVLSNQGLESKYLKQLYASLRFPKYVVGFSKQRSEEFLKAYELDKNNLDDFLEIFADILSITDYGLDYVSLINVAKKYIKAENEIETLSNQLMNLQNVVDLEQNPNVKIDLILSLLDGLTYSEGDIDNKLSFSRINKSFTLRKYVYVLGCSQTSLMGSDVENAFIENVDAYTQELDNDKNIHVASRQRDTLLNNLKYFLSHSGAQVILSYPYYDKVNLKDVTEGIHLITNSNIPHVKKNLYYLENEKEVQFAPNAETSEEECITYDNGVVNPLETNRPREKGELEQEDDQEAIIKKGLCTLSPSDVQVLVECPFRFYYQKILGIPSAQFPSLDETIWLEANARGTFFHEIMQFYFNNFINKPIKSFDQKAFEAAFKKALKNANDVNPINNNYIHDKEAIDLKDAAEEYLNRIIEDDIFDKYKVLKCECNLKDLNHIYKKNVDGKEVEYFKFTGVVDRIDGYVENDVLHLRLVDYKTGSYKSKGQNPYYQHILYTYILMHALPKNSFGLTYKSIEVDEFIYSFALMRGKGKKELNYTKDEMVVDARDYVIVFNAIDGALIPYLSDEKDLLDKLNAVFVSKNPEPKEERGYHGELCIYCKYHKECLKKLEWGKKTW